MWIAWRIRGRRHYRRDTVSTQNGMITAVLTQRSLFPTSNQTTLDISCLGEEGTLIELSARFCINMLMFCAAVGQTPPSINGSRTTLTFSVPSHAADLVEEAVVRFIMAHRSQN